MNSKERERRTIKKTGVLSLPDFFIRGYSVAESPTQIQVYRTQQCTRPLSEANLKNNKKAWFVPMPFVSIARMTVR